MSIDYSVNGYTACICLDRPESLNALTFDMINEISLILNSVQNDDKIQIILFKGKGDKAFCAGGDVKKFYDESFTDSFNLRKNFFYNEYKLNYLIKKYPKPIISLVNGICMGGGVGLSAHGKIVIVSENVKFAMPETTIGLFPDVGAGKILSSLESKIGIYLGLTGKRINASDLVELGIAQYCVPYKNFEILEKQLSNIKDKTKIDSLIKSFSIETKSDLFPVNNSEILLCFNSNKMEKIILNLKEINSDWSNEALNLLKNKSPTSLKIALRQIILAKDLSFEEDLIMEYRLSQGCMKGHDFYEGVRSVLVDKDHEPKWNPKTLEEVTNKMVESHFITLGEGDLKL